MPFIIDTLRLGFQILGQAILWAAKLGFETREVCVPRDPFEKPGRLPIWRIRLHGWSRFTRIHYITERSTTLYRWL